MYLLTAAVGLQKVRLITVDLFSWPTLWHVVTSRKRTRVINNINNGSFFFLRLVFPVSLYRMRRLAGKGLMRHSQKTRWPLMSSVPPVLFLLWQLYRLNQSDIAPATKVTSEIYNRRFIFHCRHDVKSAKLFIPVNCDIYRCIVEHVGLTYLTSLLTWYISCCSASISDVGPAVTSWTRSQLDRLNVSRGAIKRAVMSRLTAETRFRDWGGGCFGPDLNTAALAFNHIPQRLDKMTSPVQVEMCPPSLKISRGNKALACILFYITDGEIMQAADAMSARLLIYSNGDKALKG